MSYTSQAGNRHPRYFVALDDGGAFLITDRKALHKRTARYLPTEFVYGQGGYNDATRAYPAYVHSQLWALHESRQRAASEAAFRARGTVLVLPGLRVTEV